MESIRKVKPINAIAYGLGDLYGGGSFFIVGTLAMYYLISVVGLDPIWAGMVPGLGKIWDAVSDPLMGYITDHTKSRFGRRRIFFLIAILPIVLTFTLIWLPIRTIFPDAFSSQLATFLYYFTAYLFFYTTSTMTMVPYSALSAEMSENFKDKNKLTSTRMIFSILSSVIAGGLAQPIVNNFADPSTGYLVMGTIFGIFYAMPWIFVFLGTWELPHTHHESDSSVGIFQNFGSIFKNKSFRIHIGMYVCAYAAMDILMGWLLFYLTDCIGKPGMFAILLPALVFAEVLCVPLYAMLSNKFGHAKSFMIGLSIWIAGMIFMAFQTADTPNILLILNSILIGVGLSAGALIPYNLLPYVIDVDELMTKKKRSGTYSGAMTLIRKLIQGALVLPLIGVLLTAIDYKKLNLDMITFDKTNSQILALSDSMIKKNNIDYVNSTKVKLASFSDRLVLISSKIEDANQKDIFSAKANEVSGLVSNLKDASEAEQALNLASQVSELSLSIKDSLKIKQSAETSSKMRALFVFSPIAFLILGIIFALFFKISPKAHEVLMKEIDRLKKGGKKSDVKPDVKKLCEDLTGIAYDKLY